MASHRGRPRRNAFQLIRLGFSLAIYRWDTGSYPAKLADLVPKYVAAVPKDIFNDADLHYTRTGGGYLLYSVGPNGKDDGGKSYGDRKGATGTVDCDDVVVRISADVTGEMT